MALRLLIQGEVTHINGVPILASDLPLLRDGSITMEQAAAKVIVRDGQFYADMPAGLSSRSAEEFDAGGAQTTGTSTAVRIRPQTGDQAGFNVGDRVSFNFNGQTVSGTIQSTADGQLGIRVIDDNGGTWSRSPSQLTVVSAGSTGTGFNAQEGQFVGGEQFGEVSDPSQLTAPTAVDVERDFKSGALSLDLARNALTNLGVAQADAVIRHWQGGGTGTIVGPGISQTPTDFTAFAPEAGVTEAQPLNFSPGPGTVPVPVPTGGVVTPPVPDTLLQRRLADQDAEDILRRVSQQQFGLGPNQFSGLNLQALQNPFARFRATDPITNFNQPIPFDQAFASFLGGQAPGREQLGTQLSGIISGALGNQQQQAALEGIFTRPDAKTAFDQFNPAFSAAIQPTVAGVAPRFQGNVASILSNEFRNTLATDPLQFQTALQVLQDFQNRGFIPQ